MKHNIIFLLLFIISIHACFSQDIIYKKTGEKIKAKIIAEEKDQIKYLNFDDLNGPILSIPKSDVIIIQYKVKPENKIKTAKRTKSKKDSSLLNRLVRNRTTLQSNDTNNKITIMEKGTVLTLSNTELYIQGQIDASRHYKDYKLAGTLTLITSLVSPIVGLIPGITCSAVQPTDKWLNNPNGELMKIPEYYYGYLNQSKKIKRAKVWTNWAIAFSINLIAFVTLYGLE